MEYFGIVGILIGYFIIGFVSYLVGCYNERKENEIYDWGEMATS